ncbi:uncharacterized protein V6R79_010662 [Siganus canaliculatus]
MKPLLTVASTLRVLVVDQLPNLVLLAVGSRAPPLVVFPTLNHPSVLTSAYSALIAFPRAAVQLPPPALASSSTSNLSGEKMVIWNKCRPTPSSHPEMIEMDVT